MGALFNTAVKSDYVKVFILDLQYPADEYKYFKVVADGILLGEWVARDPEYSVEIKVYFDDFWDEDLDGEVRIQIYAGTNNGDWEIDAQYDSSKYVDIPKKILKPSKFYFSDVKDGKECNVDNNSSYSVITARDWNNFISKIYEWSYYKDKRSIDSNQVTSGDEFTATIYNRAIDDLIYLGSSRITKVDSGDIIRYSHFERLEDEINGL